MTTAIIKYNAELNRYRAFINGVRVMSSNDLSKMKEKLTKGYGVTNIHMEGEVVVTEVKSATVAVPAFSVNERFDFVEQFTTLVARGIIPSYIITGNGGIGKSFTVTNTLEKLGLVEDSIGETDGDFIIIKGHSTAKALYRTLFENNGKVIVFDDCDSAHKDPIAANILKGALDSTDKRVISWGAETDDGLPSRFEFVGRCIFISNLPLKKFPQALISRSMLTDLTLTQDECVDRVAMIIDAANEDDDVKADVKAFVKKYASSFADLNVRSALNVMKMRKALGEGYERMALYTISAGAGAAV